MLTLQVGNQYVIKWTYRKLPRKGLFVMDAEQIKSALLDAVYNELMNGADPKLGPQVRACLREQLELTDDAHLMEAWRDCHMRARVLDVLGTVGLWSGHYSELMLGFWARAVGPLPHVHKPPMVQFRLKAPHVYHMPKGARKAFRGDL